MFTAAAIVQGLEHLASGSVPLPAAAAAVDTASSMFSGWGSWLGMPATAEPPSGSPLGSKGSNAAQLSGSQVKAAGL